MNALLAGLQELYGRGDDQATADFRLTDRGIWYATPLAVLAAAVPLLAETDLLKPQGRPLRVLDAGAGDGRVLAALALGLPAALDLRLSGLESDAALAARARQNLGWLASLHSMPHRVAQVAEGDLFDPQAYSPLGLVPRDLDVVFNYPDGNEGRLLRWLAEHGGSQTRLVILSPDHAPARGSPPAWSAAVRATDDAAAQWTLTVFAPASTGRW